MEIFHKEMKGFDTLAKNSKSFSFQVYDIAQLPFQVCKLLLDKKCDIFRNYGQGDSLTLKQINGINWYEIPNEISQANSGMREF